MFDIVTIFKMHYWYVLKVVICFDAYTDPHVPVSRDLLLLNLQYAPQSTHRQAAVIHVYTCIMTDSSRFTVHLRVRIVRRDVYYIIQSREE